MKEKPTKKRWTVIFAFAVPFFVIVLAALFFIGPLLGFSPMASIKNAFGFNTNNQAENEWQKKYEQLEGELLDLQTQLQELSNELEVKNAELAEAQGQLDDIEANEDEASANVETENMLEEGNLTAVLKTYEQMTPKRAAALLDEMNEEEAYRHVAAMKDQLRGSILAKMPEEKAARFLERLAQEGG
ncbi:MotE family protein [Shouchella clausii]|uniref:MotE family protein n=1 Tax=Shouchella clausii TaxID=79880 RepID=UPI000BA77AFC|nr:hypothetical protein [Shouchella clausii]PAD93853.1 hypothetical protein CHH52_02750 [Shouchella clausii]